MTSLFHDTSLTEEDSMTKSCNPSIGELGVVSGCREKKMNIYAENIVPTAYFPATQKNELRTLVLCKPGKPGKSMQTLQITSGRCV